jgi:hypothetical protein
MSDALTAAKAERQKLQAKLAELAKARSKAGEPVAAFERMEQEAGKIALDTAISKWIHGGSKGPRPREGDLNGHTPPELSTASGPLPMLFLSWNTLPARSAKFAAAITAVVAAVVLGLR